MSSSRFAFLTGPAPATSRRWNPLWRFRRVLFLLTLLGFGTMLGGVWVLSQEELGELPELESFAQTSYLCMADVVGECNADNATAQFTAGEDRVIVSFDEIPQVLIDAVVATEDGDFFSHEGVDPLGIARAAYRDIRNEGVQQGGSTITQQLIKIELLTPERSITRKLKEAALAIKLERELDKETILTRYLNIIYFGRGAYGIAAASQAYFDKDVSELTLADSAFLAGLIRAPSTADPADDPEEAARRRAATLDLMVRDGMITVAEAEAAKAEDFSTIVAEPVREGLGEIRGPQGSAYVVEAVRQQVDDIAGLPDGGIYTGGYRIYTTIDPRLQTAAYNTLAEDQFDFGFDNGPEASIVAVDERGFVRAMVGGRDFETSQVNLALGRDGGGSGRQPGSSFKPFALAEAIEQGISARSYYSAPSVIEIPEANDGATWTVRGGGSPEGYRDLIDAMRISSNVVYAQLMVDLTPGTVVEMANRLGVSAELSPVNAIVLGSGEVSVLDMAASYSTFANQGIKYEPILIERIEATDGTIVCWYPVNGICQNAEGRAGDTVLDDNIARQVTFALQGVVDGGTGRAAAVPGIAAAGKTGTTQDNKDAWFVGYTCDLTAAVWMGYVGGPGEPVLPMENYRGFDEVQGGGFPAQIWSRFMTNALAIGDSDLVAGCGAFDPPNSFDGIQLNTDLSTTTLPPCAELGPVETSIVDLGDGSTSIATLPPPTTEPCEPPTTLEGDTTTTAEGETTDTTAPDSGDGSGDGGDGDAGDSTTAPPTTAPPSTESTETTEAAGDG